MRKNLLIACVGPTSLHKQWIYGDRNFDVMIVHYGDDDSYYGDGEYYIRAKGTKFNIIGDVFDQIPKEYEYIFIPDDDLYISFEDVNRLFEIAKEYNLGICQPSILGYFSLGISLHQPNSILRYTNFVEIMAPCFDRNSFEICRPTFKYNKSCWGIDILWHKCLNFSQDKIAVIDDLIAIHTRACFLGDNYKNNSIVAPHKETELILEEHGLSYDKIVYKTIKKNEDFNKPSDTRLYPNTSFMRNVCNQLRRKFFI